MWEGLQRHDHHSILDMRVGVGDQPLWAFLSQSRTHAFVSHPSKNCDLIMSVLDCLIEFR